MKSIRFSLRIVAGRALAALAPVTLALASFPPAAVALAWLAPISNAQAQEPAARASSPAPAPSSYGGLARLVPGDVFLYTTFRPDPSRAFLDRYWEEVGDAFWETGVADDAIELGFSLLDLDEDDQAKFHRVQEHIAGLIEAVDWKGLASQEGALVERMGSMPDLAENKSPMMIANMVWLSRSTPEDAARHRESLAALLEGIVEEANTLLGDELLSVTRQQRHGTEIAAVNLFAALRGAPAMEVSVASRDDLLILALQDELLEDVLTILEGDPDTPILADDPRFQSSLDTLPRDGFSMTFFDVADLLAPIQEFLERVASLVESPRETTKNTGMSAEASLHFAAGLSAYRSGEIEKAIDETAKAHEASPKNSVVLYNLACFHALAGHHDEALDWLEKAVEGGFRAPRKIAADDDLKSLRGDPRYASILTRARDLAAHGSAEDVVRNSSNEGEAYRLRMQVWQAYEEKNYELGLELADQAYAVAPDDSQVLYALARIHTVLGHEDKGLDFLEKAVRGGFYCPQHIARDTDLDAVREDPRYRDALAEATRLAAAEERREKGTAAGAILGLMLRIADAVRVVDSTATVEYTRGTSVHHETITSLVPDASSNPIYGFFGRKEPISRFDRYLPRETKTFAVCSGYDWEALYDFLVDTFRDGGRVGEEILGKWEEIQQAMGFDVRRDVLSWIGGESVNVTLEGDGGSVRLLAVRDEDAARQKISAAIAFLSTKLLDIGTEVPPLAMLASLGIRTEPVEDERLPGFQVVRSALSPDPVAVWGVTDGHLVVGTRADGVALCLETARGNHPGIRENPRAMAEMLLPEGPVVAVSLTDQRQLGEEIAQRIGIGTMVCGMMGLSIPDPDARRLITRIAGMIGKLGPVVRKIDFFESRASLTTFDGAAWHTHVVTNYVSPEERAARRAAASQPAESETDAPKPAGSATGG